MEDKVKIEELENKIKQLEINSLNNKTEELEAKVKSLKRTNMILGVFALLALIVMCYNYYA